jgi:tetratricopeptide (TPR) repeat protein
MNRIAFYCLFFTILLSPFKKNIAGENPHFFTDSLITLLSNAEENLTKVFYYNKLAEHLKESDPERALYYSRQALALGNKLQSVESCALTNKIMGEIFENEHNYQPSINYYLISIKHYKSLEENLQLAILYNKLGYIYINNHYDYDQGLAYFKTALQHAEKVNDLKEMATSLNSIGGIYYYREDYDNALLYFRDALKIRENLGDQIDIAASLNNIGEIYRLKGNYSQAMDYYNQAIKINEKLKHLKNLAINYLNTGLIYSAINESKKASSSFKQSISLNNQNKDTTSLIGGYTELGNHFNKYNQYDSALLVFQQVMIMSEAKNFLEGQRDAGLGLSIANEGKGNIKKALDNYRLYTLFKDSLFVKTKTDQLDELHTRFSLDLKEKELELKDNEIALLQREKKIFHFRQLLLILSLLLLIIFTVLIYSKLQTKHKKNRLILEQEAALSKAKQQLMEHELKNKNNELTNFALHLVEKNKFLHELKSELKNLRNAPVALREDRIKELTINVQQNINLQRDLEEFQKNIDQVNASFFQKLKSNFSNLTKNEEHLCAMLRLNLSSKEIASLNNISIRAVEMGRYRLRKKLNIPAHHSLSTYLQEL